MMKTTPKLLNTLLILGSMALAHADTVTLNDWTETGRVLNNTFTANGTAGFTELFGGPFTRPDNSVVYDSGAIAAFVTDVTLDETVNTVEFSFTVGSITATGAGSNNIFRVGFENDDTPSVDATVHYQFGYGPPGDRLDARFAGASGSANEYSQGTAFDTDFNVAGATALDTGNTSNITVRLTYLGDAGGGDYYYRAEIDWDGVTHSSSIFTRNTTTWDKVYVTTNSPAVNVLDDTYTVSNVQVTTSSVNLGGFSDVVTNDWVETGRDADNAFTGNGTDGFAELYGTDSDTYNDSGARADFASDVTLNEVFNTLQFSFTVSDISATGGSNNAFRVGFGNDDAGSDFDATIHYIFGWGVPGDNRDARFAGNSGSANEYSSGSVFDIDYNVAGATPLATGNTSNITVTLTYLQNLGLGDHEYQAEINWDGQIHTSAPFIRNTNTWDKVYVLTNSGSVNVDGDTYTVSNAQVKTGIPSTATDYDTWAGPSGFNLSGGPDDDDDGDGLSNSAEYAFGLDPTDPASLSPFTGPLSTASGLFDYTRRNPTAYSTGLTYTYEYSTTLAPDSWLPFTPDVDPPATDGGDPVETVTVDVPDALLANTQLFIRIVAQ